MEPRQIDAEFCKAWMLFFCRSGHPVITVDHFWVFVGHLPPQETNLELPRITGRELGVLDGWAWNEVQALLLSGFSGLAILLEMVEATGV